MTAIGRASTNLHWDVLAIKRPGLTRELPPGKEEYMWVANSSTLIYGERDAVLVDTLLTAEQSKTLLGWVVAHGKNLTAIYIYITHGHGDHFFGLALLLERFPRAKAVAAPEIVKAMREHLSPAWIENFLASASSWEIPDHLLVAESLHSTCLHVPSIGLIVGGDVVYNGIHPLLGEMTHRAGLSGSPRSTSSRPWNRKRWLPGTRCPKMIIIRASSPRHGNTFAISTA